MIKVQIKKQNIVTNEAKFETQLEVESWVLKESQNGSFGKLDRWLRESDFRGESIDQSVTSRIVEGQLGQPPYTEYNFPQEFEIVYTDITLEVQIQQESKEALQYLKDTDYLIIREIDAGTLCPADIKVLRAAARLKVIK